MTTVSNNNSPHLTLVEQGSAPDTPAAGSKKLFLDSADGNLYLIDEADVVTPVGSATAFHSDADGEIDGLTEKATPVAGDLILIEDSEDGFAKKKLDVDNLPGGGGGGLVLLEQHTASSSAILAFTTGITSTYDDYLLEIVDLIVATNNVALGMQYSADGGSSYETGSNYYSAGSYIQNGGSLGTQGANPGTSFILGAGLTNTVSRPFQATLHLRSLLSTALSKIIYGEFAYTNQSFVVGGNLNGLLLVPGTAYNTFKLFCSSGNIASGVARLYGVEK